MLDTVVELLLQRVTIFDKQEESTKASKVSHESKKDRFLEELLEFHFAFARGPKPQRLWVKTMSHERTVIELKAVHKEVRVLIILS